MQIDTTAWWPYPPYQPTPTAGLTVSLSGSGTVTGPSINCQPTCAAQYATGAQVTLQATPGSGQSFTGWSGDCTGTASCTLTLSRARAVTANFAAVTIVGQLAASWTAPTQNTDGSTLTDLSSYRVYYATSPSSPCRGPQFQSVGAGALSTTIGALTNGQSYTATITAINSAGNESVCSATATAVARGQTPLPGTPQIGTPTLGATTASFPVSWGASIDPVTGNPVATYTWSADFNDGVTPQTGTLSTTSMTLVMPYHADGLASTAFFCVVANGTNGPSGNSCNGFTVPAKP